MQYITSIDYFYLMYYATNKVRLGLYKLIHQYNIPIDVKTLLSPLFQRMYQLIYKILYTLMHQLIHQLSTSN